MVSPNTDVLIRFLGSSWSCFTTRLWAAQQQQQQQQHTHEPNVFNRHNDIWVRYASSLLSSGIGITGMLSVNQEKLMRQLCDWPSAPPDQSTSLSHYCLWPVCLYGQRTWWWKLNSIKQNGHFQPKFKHFNCISSPSSYLYDLFCLYSFLFILSC